jgi:hypothetical protein
MKKIIFTESQIKKVVKRYINEASKMYDEYLFGKYNSDIDKIKRKGEKVYNPSGFYSSHEDDSYFDTLNQDKQAVKDRDISYLGDWKKTSNKTPYYDKFKDSVDMGDDSTPARKNPINTPAVDKKIRSNEPTKSINSTKSIASPKIDKFKKLNDDIDHYLGNIVLDKQERNADSIKSAVHYISSYNSSFFPPIESHVDYEMVDGDFKNVMRIKNAPERIKMLKDLINQTRDTLKLSSFRLISAFKMKDKVSDDRIIDLLNDVQFYKQMLVYMERAKSKAF